ncbi:uncharacterized protein LOC131650771 [Vicia villosa]|uniref:uncharacterized protein LOC131650771 n=1 Tax=Vicia villosa TaxID=3911 RepID=UPI00273B1567|nr:uncharacterized protein LOC131650771 [Vicia villosa]
MGFGVLWMEVLVFTSKILVLVNGNPTKEFVVDRGLRQGDSLSSFLFVLVTEGLTGLVRKAVENGEYIGVDIKGKCQIGILQVVDDTLMVGEGSWKHVSSLKAILRAFEIVSGLGINYHKSKIIGINVSCNFLGAAASFLSCKMEGKEFVFLGILIGSNPMGISTWNTLLLKMKKHFSSWKVKIAKEFVKLQGKFLWGVEEKRRIHWIKWKDICLPIDKGSLGIKNIDTFNLALLNKWRWRILEGSDSLWYKILQARYRDICLQAMNSGNIIKAPIFSSSWWTNLTSIKKKRIDDVFVKCCRFEIGRGYTTSFWHSIWIDDIPLKFCFLGLFSSWYISCGDGGWLEGVWQWGFFGIPQTVSELSYAAADLQ